VGRLRIAPIVEGHGEYEAIRILLTRIFYDLLGGERLEVVRPIRLPRSKILNENQLELRRALELAGLKLNESQDGWPAMVLILIDADTDLPCEIGPQLLEAATRIRPDLAVSAVLANVEYETWFVGAAESLPGDLDLSQGPPPEDPEGTRSGKGWIETRFRGTKYSETVDQPAMTARMDLSLCRRRCPSFDKLCRDLDRHLRASARR
jgi:hypothetical protein